MTDINEWNIGYTALNGYGVNYDFGSLALGSPFSAQVSISDADSQYNDQPHGFEDATFMGRDQVLATDIIFKMTTVPGATATQITDALDKISQIEAIWRAPGLRRDPSKYALLTNKLRNRYTRGRPRNFSRDDSRLRKGIVGCTAQFRTITPYWSQLPVRTLTPARTVSTPQAIAGDVLTWPLITFTGAFSTASLKWTPGFWLQPWTITVNTPLANGETITIDTRPENRYAYDASGVFKNGALAGDPMSKAFMAPDHPSFPASGAFLFTTTGTTSAATKCQVQWFDMYAGL